MQTSILARMAVRQKTTVSDVPLTSSRALRVAMTRAADKALGLSLSVTGVGEEFMALDGIVDSLPAEYLYAGLERSGETIGLIGLDGQMRAAVIEMQTIGNLVKTPQTGRAPTSTDMMLAAPLCDMLLKLIPETTAGSDLDGWAGDVVLGDAFESLRSAGLALQDTGFRLMRLTLDLTVGERQGEIVLALPNLSPLNAILCRMTLPIGKIDNLQVGDILPLYGATVSTVRLYAPEGIEVGAARLGQSGGMRAIRIETPVALSLRDSPAPAPKKVAVTAG